MTTGDQLLYVLSAKRELGWPAFKSVFDSLLQSSQSTVENIPFLRSRTLRLLDSFGYCDFEFRKGTGSIFVCPATVARLPLRECSGALLGARAPSTMSVLEKAAKASSGIAVSLEEHDDALFVPSRITIRAADLETLVSYCSQVGLPIENEPPCWKLASVSSDVCAYLDSLKWFDGTDLNWKAWQFDPEYCEFRSERSDSGRFRLMRYLDPTKNTFRYRLWEGMRYADVEVEWARYIVLNDTGFSVLFYDPVHHLFAVPRNAYFPRLLQRALGLCSGLPPVTYGSRNTGSTRPQKPLDLFESVPSEIADAVSKKIGQTLSYCQLN